MVQIQKKSAQANTAIFNGNFLANKPVNYGSQPNVQPYSNLFYWSHSSAIADCEFPLHPHKGFEIMTFVNEGEIRHFDDKTNKWTSLKTGDFQVIQCNAGIQHRERISKGTEGFQIWFDPDFQKSTRDKPAYTDYYGIDFKAKNENGINTTTYIGQGSIASARTPGLSIKKLTFPIPMKVNLPLDVNSRYTFYVMSGNGFAHNSAIEKDDAVRISDTKQIDINFMGDLFFIQTPDQIDYKTFWGK